MDPPREGLPSGNRRQGSLDGRSTEPQAPSTGSDSSHEESGHGADEDQIEDQSLYRRYLGRVGMQDSTDLRAAPYLLGDSVEFLAIVR